MKIQSGFINVFILLFSVSVASAACVPEYSCPDWGLCAEGIQTRTCNDIACGSEPIIERQLCVGDTQCNVQYSCSAWSACTYFDKTNDILNNNIRFTGYQERSCVDLNQCVEPFIDQQSCEDSFEVKFLEVEQCGTNYIMALDANSEKTVSQVNVDLWRSQVLDIAFVQSNFSFCPSCYNGLQDDDEEGIDCGGSCKECSEEFGLSEQTVLIASSWTFAALLLIGFVSTSMFNRAARTRYLIYRSYKAIENKDSAALRRNIEEIKKNYKKMSDSQKAIFKKDLDKLYRRI